MSKKGLVVVYDPHNLYEFVWYYCNRGKDKEWDALCLPNAQKGEYMHTYCEMAGIFKHVYRDDTGYDTASAGRKAALFLSMLCHFITGKRKAFCRKLLNRFISLDEYDEIVVIAGVGIVSGACIALGKEMEVVILEDGINDYSEQPRMIPFTKLNSLYNWQGCILAAMGYCNPGWYRLNTTKNCIKYSSQPEKMIYRNYREIKQLYESEGTDQERFGSIVKQIYPALQKIDFDSIQSVLFTRPMIDYVKNDSKYRKKIESYINENFRSIIIKRHPREDEEYHFADGMNCTEIDNSIPAEALLPYLKDKSIVVVMTSGITLYMKAFGLKCTILTFDGLFDESVSSGAKFAPMTDEEVIKYCERFAEGCYEIERI